jgi:hypothetical protein
MSDQPEFFVFEKELLVILTAVALLRKLVAGCVVE